MWKPQICTKFGDERGIQVCIYILATENGTNHELNGFQVPFDHRYVLMNGASFTKGKIILRRTQIKVVFRVRKATRKVYPVKCT